MKILVINSGSSSIKFQLLDMADETVLASGLVERIGESGSLVKCTMHPGRAGETVLSRDEAIGIGLEIRLPVDDCLIAGFSASYKSGSTPLADA